jgi:glutamate-ammonia-ligase adenylyltransferase
MVDQKLSLAEFIAEKSSWPSLTERDCALSSGNLSHLLDPEDELGARVMAFLDPVLRASPFLSAHVNREKTLLLEILASRPDVFLLETHKTMVAALGKAGDERHAMACLRKARASVMLCLALADIAGYYDVSEVTTRLSDFAGQALQGALIWLWREAARQGKLILKHDHKQQPLQIEGYTVLGMGKLGAGELNYSSDIDLIVFYDADKAPLAEGQEPGRFFVRLTRRLMQFMHDITGDGFVFRTDLRLRPDPSSTPLALSLDAALMYYESLALNWERAAMIKARPVAGDLELGACFSREIRPFVWRRTMDYQAIQDIRSMKRRILDVKNLHHKALFGYDVKLGRGGIRDIEFFVQTQQLISAGRDPSLRVPQTLKALERLNARGWIDEKACDDLTRAYCFLRNVEHRIQLQDDRQTHCLPDNEEAIAQIALLMGYESPDVFHNDLAGHVLNVQTHTRDLFEGAHTPVRKANAPTFLSLEGVESQPDNVVQLSNMGFDKPEECEAILRRWAQGHYPSLQSDKVRQNLLHVLPDLLQAFVKTGHGDHALSVFDDCLKNLPTGLQMFALLEANPKLCELLALIMGTAPRLSAHLGRHPFVLAEVMQPDFFNPDFQTGRWNEELRPYLREALSYEDVLDRARLYGQSQHFQVGVRFLTGLDDAIKAGQHYSALAEIVLQQLFEHSLDSHRQRYGLIEGLELAIVAMGRLGSREMRATSDLDLILIYDSPDPLASSDGPKSLSLQHYTSRFMKTLVTALSALTARGKLYEVDTRLRPSGNSGPLATSFEAFRHYQFQEAWTWEHMALTRARSVAGNQALMDRVDALRLNVLQQDFDPLTLVTNIDEMRQRLAREKPPRHEDDLKAMKGGLTDLDFSIQTLKLLHGRNDPDLLQVAAPDFFKVCPPQLLPNGHETARLEQIYQLYSGLDQAFRLCMKESQPLEECPRGFQDFLLQLLHYENLTDLKATLEEAQHSIHDFYQCLITV